MPVTSDITATYRGPGRVMRKLMAMGAREDRALAFLMGFCVIAFIASMPDAARQAHLEDKELNPILGVRLYSFVFLLPLALYMIALLSHFLRRMLRWPSNAYHARLALFWSLLATTPVALLWGMVAGFLGDGIAFDIAATIWWIVFLWFWIATLRASGEGAA